MGTYNLSVSFPIKRQLLDLKVVPKLHTMIKLLIINALITILPIFSMLNRKGIQIPSPHENRASLDSIKIKMHPVRILFWNVENLYDPFDDSVTIDEEFTATGAKRWTWTRFGLKLNHVAKTLLAAGGWVPPGLACFCEVENRFVLERLVRETPLRAWNWRIIHRDSPDRRGVDVAMLFRPDQVEVFSTRYLHVQFPQDTAVRTRDILLAGCLLHGCDTLYVAVNHWPSRRGGEALSKSRRNRAATVLRMALDSIRLFHPGASILIMGDFNDEPADESLRHVLGARLSREPVEAGALYNLMGIRNLDRPEGTLRYRDQWSTFDQFIVSGALMAGLSGLRAGPDQAKVFRPAFLLEEDRTWFGKKLVRTYNGPAYQGGFSDHLPVVVDVLRE